MACEPEQALAQYLALGMLWEAVRLQLSDRSQVGVLVGQAGQLMGWAKRLHVGVGVKRERSDDDGELGEIDRGAGILKVWGR